MTLTTRHYSQPMAASTRGINKSLLPSAKTRATIAKRLAGVTGKMTTATIAEMESTAPLVSRAGCRAPIMDHAGSPGRHRRIREAGSPTPGPDDAEHV